MKPPVCVTWSQGSRTPGISAVLRPLTGPSPVHRGSEHPCTLWPACFQVKSCARTELESQPGLGCTCLSLPPSPVSCLDHSYGRLLSFPSLLAGAPPGACGIAHDFNLWSTSLQKVWVSEQGSDMPAGMSYCCLRLQTGMEGPGQVDQEQLWHRVRTQKPGDPVVSRLVSPVTLALCLSYTRPHRLWQQRSAGSPFPVQ